MTSVSENEWMKGLLNADLGSFGDSLQAASDISFRGDISLRFALWPSVLATRNVPDGFPCSYRPPADLWHIFPLSVWST